MKKNDLYRLEDVGRDFRMQGSGFQPGKIFSAVDAVSFTIQKGAVTGLAGVSGSGKTTLARILAGCLRPSRGRLFYEGRPLREVLESRKAPFYRKVQMIFQNPYQSLDPKWKLQDILQEGMPRRGSGRELKDAAAEALHQVGLPPVYLERKPGALSGGERQRVAIARALAVKPEFLILDEPTSQLDVTVQAQLLKLLLELKPLLSGGMLFITHDLALLSHLSDRLAVMSDGRLVEEGPTREILSSPQHAATQALIRAVPHVPGSKS
ncbi:MAG: ABC transporter ATP-binding protein [Candidatus Omnitrophica bacterium]|nr:ABC transporter ATP-binding protein [Candidatus Omnitrophota bacterium]